MEMGNKEDNRRKFPRSNVDVEIQFRHGTQDWREGRMMDFSKGGLKLKADVELEFGQVVELKFQSFNIRGTVRWKDEHWYGIQFVL